MDNTLSIINFWDKCHENKSMIDLSGSSYEDTLYSLKLQEYVHPNIHVLEVGVGFGYVIEGFYKQGVVISALDVSGIALDSVAGWCEFLFKTDQLEKIPVNYFDIITCVNVVQHIPTDVLREELFYLIRSLTEHGVFAIQFISYNDIDDTWNESFVHKTAESLSFCRSINYMINLIESVGGFCNVVVDDVCDLPGVSGCHVLHIRRKNNV